MKKKISKNTLRMLAAAHNEEYAKKEGIDLEEAAKFLKEYREKKKKSEAIKKLMK